VRQASRSRLPLPPVPAASRPGVPAASRPAAAPATSAAPFRAVPTPERPELIADESFPPARVPAGAAARSRSGRAWADDDAALVSTGPSAPGALRGPGRSARVPRQTTPAGSPSPAYGDWTKPSLPGDEAELGGSAESGLRSRAGTRRPERSASGLRDRGLDTDGSPAEVAGPASGPIAGGRAAQRAERQAAELARRKAAKRNGTPLPEALEDEEEPGKPRRVVKGLLAMTVVALGVLGVYSYMSPETQETGSQTATEDSVPDVTGTLPNPLPELPTTPVDVEPVVSTPVRAPVTVLNATEINGLAAKAATALNGGGWETPGVGGYTAGDVAASTVFFTEGDETQRQAALQLVDAFPQLQLQGPTPRFFELPADVTAPGLVVVLAADWQS
jgi:hypothetical protein